MGTMVDAEKSSSRRKAKEGVGESWRSRGLLLRGYLSLVLLAFAVQSACSVSDLDICFWFLMDAERAWSYAMQLKQEANTSRKRFHLLSRLRKAVKHAEELNACVRATVDAKTKLEAQVSVTTHQLCFIVEIRDVTLKIMIIQLNRRVSSIVCW